MRSNGEGDIIRNIVIISYEIYEELTAKNEQNLKLANISLNMISYLKEIYIYIYAILFGLLFHHTQVSRNKKKKVIINMEQIVFVKSQIVESETS